MSSFSLIQFGTAIICLFFSYVGRKNNKNRHNPLYLFNLEWALILGLGILNLLGYYVISEYTAFIILIGVVSFNLGVLSSSKMIGEHYERTRIQLFGYRNCSYNKLLVEIIFFFPPLYLTTKMLKVLPMLQAGLSYGYIRIQYWTTKSIITGGFDYFLNNTVCKAFELIIVPYVLLEIFQKRLKIHHLLLCILSIGLEVFIAGGRMILLETIFVILLMLSISGISFSLPEKFRKKIKKRLYIGIGLAIVGIAFITGDRQSEMSFFSAITSNFTLCLPLMDYLVNLAHKTGDMMYGLVFFRGFLEIICTFTGPIGFSFPKPLVELDKYTNPFYPISDFQVANAYTSMFLDFYLDGRIIGVILGCLIFGFIVQRIYLRMRSNPNDELVIIYIIFCKAILYSFFQWKFMMGAYVLAVIITRIIYLNTKSEVQG